jgi:hypothetical protein
MKPLRLVLILVGLGLLAFGYGFISARYEVFPYRLIMAISGKGLPPGRWHAARGTRSTGHGADDSDRNLEELAALPYLAGYHPATDDEGVVAYDSSLAHNGLNLVVSGHAPQALLMDMHGRVMHEWEIDYRDVWPGELPFYVPERTLAWWRRAHAFPNGDILAIFEGLGMVKLDKDCNLIWVYSGRVHHDLFVAPDGKIYTLTRSKREECDALKLEGHILEDFITILRPDGKEVESVSILEAFLRSQYASALDFLEKSGDVFHTNTIQLLGSEDAGKVPIFEEGQVLISVRNINTIAVVDLETEMVTWALSGMWVRQHEPSICPNGNLLLFDNRGHRGRSKVIEFNPLTQEVVWTYAGDPPDDFYSRGLGSCQRLPNGNTLITESDYGRAFEVTPDKRIVWEFLNPYRAGKEDELVASLFDVVRIHPDQVPFLSQR